MSVSNLRSLRIFADVIATGSFTAAAEVHGVTQPAVSFHIRQLEAEFGTMLIVRSGRKAMPTAAGAELLRHISRIEQAIDSASREMGKFSTVESAPLRIGTGSTACAALLPAVLRLVRRSLPNIEISVVTGNSPEIARKLVADEIDIGLVTLPIRDYPVVTEPLFEDEIVVLAPTAMDLPNDVPPHALADHAAMVYESARVTRELIENWFRDAGIPFHPAMTVGSMEAIRELVSMEMGYAVISRLALPAVGVPDGVVVRSLSPQLHRTIGFALRRDHLPHISRDIFLAALRRQIDVSISRPGGGRPVSRAECGSDDT